MTETTERGVDGGQGQRWKVGKEGGGEHRSRSETDTLRFLTI